MYDAVLVVLASISSTFGTETLNWRRNWNDEAEKAPPYDKAVTSASASFVVSLLRDRNTHLPMLRRHRRQCTSHARRALSAKRAPLRRPRFRTAGLAAPSPPEVDSESCTICHQQPIPEALFRPMLPTTPSVCTPCRISIDSWVRPDMNTCTAAQSFQREEARATMAGWATITAGKAARAWRCYHQEPHKASQRYGV